MKAIRSLQPWCGQNRMNTKCNKYKSAFLNSGCMFCGLVNFILYQVRIEWHCQVKSKVSDVILESMDCRLFHHTGMFRELLKNTTDLAWPICDPGSCISRCEKALIYITWIQKNVHKKTHFTTDCMHFLPS